MSPTKVLLTEGIREWSEVFMHRSMRDFKRFMDATGLSFSQINILMRLFHGGCAGVSEIGDQLGVTNAAASQAVDRLVQLGLIERTEDPEDRRAKRLALTQKGRTLIEKGVEVRSQWIEGLTDALTPEQQNMIISALTLLTEAVRKTKE
ncbi:MAG: MarR family transcriptional regulator [Candidatus Atribacteria bacterium]|nr:MarR family transcriptional regulator [Candidatus Atribacteria bacterium]